MPNHSNEERTSKQPNAILPGVKIEKSGIAFNWRTCLFVLIILAGGGGVAGLNLLPNDIQITTEPALSAEHTKTHETIDTKLGSHDQLLVEQGKAIGEVKLKIDEVQAVQHKQYAREEARRSTESIKDATIRMREYDRLIDLNLKRLSRGSDPCSNVNCSN